METVLNKIIDNARVAKSKGLPAHNPYPAGTLRHLAYEIGTDTNSTGVVATRVDGQVYAVMEVDEGEYQSVVPSDMADLSACHGSLRDAVDYVRELAVSAGDVCETLVA